MTDQRLSLTHHRIAHEGNDQHEGNVWFVDAKFDRATNVLKVSRIHGDVTSPLLTEALQALADEMGLFSPAHTSQRGRPAVRR